MNAPAAKNIFLSQSDHEFQDELRRIQSAFRAQQHISPDRNEHDANKNMSSRSGPGIVSGAFEPQGLRLQTIAEEELSFNRAMDERVLKTHQQTMLRERTADRLLEGTSFSLEPQDHDR